MVKLESLKKSNQFKKALKEKYLNKSIAKANGKIEMSKVVGESLAEKLKNNKISQVIFDRNGYKYHGRVKALADSVREAGIKL